MPTLRHLLPLLCLLTCLGLPVWADKPVYDTSQGAAIRGYDAVAYFTKGTAIRGTPEIRVMWKGVVWHFANDAHREAFEANPRAYAPQYGGYCAYAVAQGYTMPTDPSAWRIVDGKLYLTHNTRVLKLWLRDVPRHLALSEAHWPAVLKK